MKFFFVFGKSLPLFPEWLRAQSFFQCRAQSFVLAAFATLVCQRNCVFLCKGTKAQEFGLCRILRIVMPVFCGTEFFPVAQSFGGQSLSSRPSRRRVEGSCIGFWKSKANSTFCKVIKQKGEGKPTFSTRSFPLSLRPSPLPCGDQGSPPGPPMPVFCGTELRFCVWKLMFYQ